MSHTFNTALFFSDIAGYSRMFNTNQELAMNLLEEHNILVFPIIEKKSGTVIKLIGDAVFARFDSSLNCLTASLEIQEKLAERNSLLDRKNHIQIRIGLHYGNVIEKDNDLYGHSVNLCSRIEAVSPIGSIAASQTFMSLLKLNNFYSRCMGWIKLKNITQPIELYKIYHNKTSFITESESDLRLFQEKRGIQFVDPETYNPVPIVPIGIAYFNNLSSDKDDIYCYSTTELLLNELRKVERVNTPSIQDIIKLKGTPLSNSELARTLQVDHLIVGSVLVTDNELSISYSLFNTKDGSLFFEKSETGSIKYLKPIIAKMIYAVAETLTLELDEAHSKLMTQNPTENEEAYKNFLKAKRNIDQMAGQDKLKQAESWLNNAIELDENFIEAYSWRAMALRWFGDFNQAEELLESAEEIGNTNHLEHSLAIVYNHFGILYRQMKKFRKSITYSKKAMDIQLILKDTFEQAKIFQNIAGCYSVIGEFDRAENYFNKAMELYLELDAQPGIANTYAELGNFYEKQDKVFKSIDHYEKAMGMYQFKEMYIQECRVRILLLSLYLETGDYKLAQEQIDNAVPIAEEFNDPDVLARLFYYSGDLNIVNGKYEIAMDNYEKSADMYDMTPFLDRSLNSRLKRALVSIEHNEFATAKKILNKCKLLAQKTEWNPYIYHFEIIQFYLNAANGETGDEPEKVIKLLLSDKYRVPKSWENAWILAKAFLLQNRQREAGKYQKYAQDLIQSKIIKLNSDFSRDILQKNKIYADVFSNLEDVIKNIEKPAEPAIAKFCPECGAKNPGKFKFCPECGNNLVIV